MHYLCSENTGADQLRSYCEVDLYFCFGIIKMLGFLLMLPICHIQVITRRSYLSQKKC